MANSLSVLNPPRLSALMPKTVKSSGKRITATWTRTPLRRRRLKRRTIPCPALTAQTAIFRADDGKVLAREVASLDYATPIVEGNIVYFIENGGKAVRLPVEVKEALEPEILWVTGPRKDRYYASSIFQDGLIYAIHRNNHFSVIDATNGEVVFDQKLKSLGKGTTYPSITLAGNLLLVSSNNGTTIVIKPGPVCGIIAKNKISGFRSSPLISQRRMYIRAFTHLYCIGQ
jgi:hypothetical protein